MRVVVTGGSGKLGRAVVGELIDHGHEVWNVDLAASRDPRARFTRVDLTGFGQVYERLRGIDKGWPVIDGLVPLAAIPRPAQVPHAEICANNTAGSSSEFASATHT